jgi:hypothetical protein
MAVIDQGVALLAAVPGWSLSDAQLRGAVASSFGLVARVEAAHLRFIAELDDRPDAVPGARPGMVARTFLRHALHRTAGQAAADVRAAHAVAAPPDGSSGPGIGGAEIGRAHGGDLAGVGAALAQGRVSRGHLDAAVRVLEGLPRAAREQGDEDGVSGAQRVDAFLAEWAPKVSSVDTLRLGQELAAHLDPNGADGFDQRAYARRSFSLHRAPGGGFVPAGYLSTLTGGVLAEALDVFGAPAGAAGPPTT